MKAGKLGVAKEYNDVLGMWFKGIEWLHQESRTEDEKERGFKVLQKRLEQLRVLYNNLQGMGVVVVAEEYIDTTKIEVPPPF